MGFNISGRLKGSDRLPCPACRKGLRVFKTYKDRPVIWHCRACREFYVKG